MKKVIFILVCLYPVFVFSAINERITDVYFANGILTEKEDAYKNLDLIEENILFNEYSEDEDKMKKELHFDLAYNGTYGESLDILESLTQKLGKFELIDDTLDLLAEILDVSVKESDLTIQVKAYKDSIHAGHRVLTVAHSQGNLFTYDAYRDLDIWMQDYFYAISVASPGHFPIKNGTRSISWDNDVVAKLGLYGGLEPNPVRKVSWELLTEDGHQITTPRPDFNYVIKEQVGIALKNDWNGTEGITSNFDSNVHAFSFYMGEALKIESKIPVINPFDGQVLKTNKAKSRIMGAIQYGLKTLKNVPSQWNITDKANEGTKEYLGTFTHKYAPEASQLFGLIFKDDNNSALVYQVPDIVGIPYYVKASFGGERILDTWDGQDEDTQFYKLEGTDPIEYIEDKICKDPSLFEVISQQNESTKEWRVTVKNKETSETTENVYPFNLDGSLYQLNGEWVLASCNGTQILETWDNQDKEKQFYKLQGTDPVEYIEGKVCKDMSAMIPGGLFNAQLRWNEPLVEMQMANSLMSESVNGCGISAIGSGDLSLYSVYPGTYPIGVSASGYESLVDKDISDTVTLNVRAVTASSKDSFTVTKAYQYAHLGKNGHLADILITRPDPAKPPVVEAIPTIPTIAVESTNSNTYGSRPHSSPSVSFSSSSHSYYSGETTHVPSVQHMPPLCNESCGCLPCEYAILSYLNQARLGPISGAKVTLYKASEEDNPQRELLYEGSTSVSDKIDKAGVISLPIPYPEQKTFSAEEQALMDAIAGYDGDFILELSGGFDIDKNDDLVVDSTYTHLGGKLHLILDKKSLLNNDYKVNILTEIAYQLSKDLLGSSYDKQRVQERLDDIAKRVLIEKLYPVAEEPLGRLDLFYWIPSAHKNWLIKPYAKVASIVEKVYKGEDIYDDAYRFVYEEIQPAEQQNRPEPILSSKWLKVSEGIEGSTDIGEVTAKSEGKSSIVSYHLSREGSELFAIDDAGVVSLREGKTLDFEKKKLYQMSLTAKNSDGESRPVTLYVVVSNVVDSPEDRNFEGGVFSEDAVSGKQVGFLHFDEGTSPIETIEIAGADADAFEIALDGNITLSDTANFDYEKKNYAQITVQAFNAEGKSRVVPITFTITDAVDVPIVNTLDVHLREGAIVGQVVGQMRILSNDPIIDITLSGRGSENFEISQSGIVIVADGATIDYESVSNYVLKVQASNVQGMSREGMLVIRIDDAVDIPVLANTTLRMPEFSAIGTVVGKASVQTSGKYPIDSFTLNSSINFTIDDSGEITVANDTLSYTNQQYFTLYATAINSEGSSRRVSVIIYIDTKRPLLGVLDTYVYENSISGTKIGKVPSTNNALTIESARIEGEGSENFKIDTNLDISVAEGALLNYESKTSYVLKVFASNSAGESDAKSVYIRVVDRDDTIKIAGFSTTIYEDSKAGDTIGIVKVISVGGLTIDHYTLSGKGSENFEVTSSGIVTISDSAVFDRKKHSNYHLLLTASDANTHKSNGVYLDISVVKSANTPVALSQNISLDEDSAKAIELIATDKDGDTLSYTIVTPPTKGVYEGGIYTPSANFNGRDEIVYKANDGKFDSELATIVIMVNPVNDKPVVTSQNITLDEDIATSIGLIATDVDGDTLVSTIVTAPLHGTYANGTYIPSANYFGTDKIGYKVNDGTIDSDLATISITVNSINDIPVALSQNITLDEDTSKTIKLSATDIEGDTLTYKVLNQPRHGTYKEGVYAPSENYHGIDSFTFVANDGQDDSSLATVSIVVNSTADLPSIISPFSAQTKENVAPDTLVGKLTLDDGDSPISDIKLIGDGTEKFRVTLDGSIYTKVSLDYEVATNYIFKAIAINGVGKSKAADVTITVIELDDISPTIVKTNPINEKTDVSVNSLVTVIFSENIVSSSKDIIIRDLDNHDINGTLIVEGNKITFIPDNILEYQMSYEVTLSNNIHDLAGNIFKGYSFIFETKQNADIGIPSPIADFRFDDSLIDRENNFELTGGAYEFITKDERTYIKASNGYTNPIITDIPYAGLERSYRFIAKNSSGLYYSFIFGGASIDTYSSSNYSWFINIFTRNQLDGFKLSSRSTPLHDDILESSQWHDFVVNIDHKIGRYELFIDGVRARTGSDKTFTRVHGNQNRIQLLAFTNFNGNYAHPLDGLDIFQVYDRFLTQEEVESIYNE